MVAVGDLNIHADSAINVDWDRFPLELFIKEAGFEPVLDANREDIHKEQHDTIGSQEYDGIWRLTEDNVEKISIGAAILGT